MLIRQPVMRNTVSSEELGLSLQQTTGCKSETICTHSLRIMQYILSIEDFWDYEFLQIIIQWKRVSPPHKHRHKKKYWNLFKFPLHMKSSTVLKNNKEKRWDQSYHKVQILVATRAPPLLKSSLNLRKAYSVINLTHIPKESLLKVRTKSLNISDTINNYLFTAEHF